MKLFFAINVLFYASVFAEELPQEIIAALDSVKFEDREAAEKSLKEWSQKLKEPKAIVKASSEALLESKSPQVRASLKAFLKPVVTRRLEMGFLGVNHVARIREIEGKEIPYIEIQGVSPNTPAQRAGMLPGDLIFAVNGTPLNLIEGTDDQKEEEVTKHFSYLIKKNQAGDKVKIDILSRGQIKQYTVIMNSYQEYANANRFNLRELYDKQGFSETENDFYDRWYEEYIREKRAKK